MIKKQKVLVLGSLAYDRIMDFPGNFSDHIVEDKIRSLSLSFMVSNFRESYGGTAGNIAYSLALLGCRPVILSTAGRDFGPYRKHLMADGVDCSRVLEVKEQPTACATIMTDRADSQIAGFMPGAMAISLPLNRLKRLKAEYAIVSPGNIKNMIEAPAYFKRWGLPYIYDPGQQITTLKNKDILTGIKGSEILIGNDYEIALISKRLILPVNKLNRLVPTVIITQGENGSSILSSYKVKKLRPAKPKNTIDPTGAGDAYRAGLIAGLVRGWTVEKSCQLASTVSVYTVEKYGTQTHRFTNKELTLRLKNNYR